MSDEKRTDEFKIQRIQPLTAEQAEFLINEQLDGTGFVSVRDMSLEEFRKEFPSQADEREAKTLRDYAELGARRMQVVLLREALRRYGTHEAYCPKIAETYVPYNGTVEDMERAKLAAQERAEQAVCNCGLAEALLVGAGAEAAVGMKEEWR